MMAKGFDTSSADAQATLVEPCRPELFDFAAYMDYENALKERCRKFWQADSGILVYRRMRVAQVYSYGSKDMKTSLEWQIGALKKSMEYKADVPNFLEPWYGIGTIASAYGASYQWIKGQAPAIKPLFQSVNEALNSDTIPVAETDIGRHTLQMIEYFLDKTNTKLPISITDTQSPLNCACNIVNISSFMMETVTEPNKIRKLLDHLADLLIEFSKKQLDLIGSRIVWPGHGFASSTEFEGIGMSDDNMLMLSGESYFDLAVPSMEKFGSAFGGPVFHSCGNWSQRLEWVKRIKGLKIVDGAFSEETDPQPNPVEPFNSLAKTGLVLNARIVGDSDTVLNKARQLWQSGMKLVVVTYCDTPEEQEIVYNQLHEMCR